MGVPQPRRAIRRHLRGFPLGNPALLRSRNGRIPINRPFPLVKAQQNGTSLRRSARDAAAWEGISSVRLRLQGCSMTPVAASACADAVSERHAAGVPTEDIPAEGSRGLSLWASITSPRKPNARHWAWAFSTICCLAANGRVRSIPAGGTSCGKCQTGGYASIH